MIRHALIATLLIGAAPTFAASPRVQPGETAVPHMSTFLEWIPDGPRGLYVRADSGRWYYARFLNECPRLSAGGRIRFDASPADSLDRYSAVRIDGWRCQIDSVVASEAPPSARRH
jgi:hypothetical protein